MGPRDVRSPTIVNPKAMHITGSTFNVQQSSSPPSRYAIMQHVYLPPSPSSPNKRERTAPGSSSNVAKKSYASVGTRVMSASEVARSVKHFETWCAHQCCEQVALSDIPPELAEDVGFVFDLDGHIPLSWISDVNHNGLSSSLKDFLRTAHKARPGLFCDDTRYTSSESGLLFDELTTVKMAWNRLQTMRRSGEKWSEADFAANVYNVFRAPAIHRSSYRYQCPISLPQPLEEASEEAWRAVHPKSAVPDGAVFIKASSIRCLSHSLRSPFKVLNVHPSVTRHSRVRLEQGFRFQTTPCTRLPETACFEFIGSVWEDKKPCHEMLEQAYRQNRMSTAACARMIYSLGVKSCVFGLVWADGIVRAHVDWCSDSYRERPTVFSAPYDSGDEAERVFHEWELDRPDGILQIYFLVRNIDVWICTRFRERVVSGVNAFCENVTNNSEEYVPWKRTSTSSGGSAGVTEGKENEPPLRRVRRC